MIEIKFQTDVTFVIKTFERPKSLIRLLKSLAKVHPWCKVLILDDSKKPYSLDVFNSLKLPLYAVIINAPHDCGLSEGRNILLSKVDTQFVVLLDDDFEFKGPVMYEALRHLLEHEADLVAVTLWNQIKRKKDAVCQNVSISCGRITQTPIPLKGWAQADMVNNCFIARTDPVRNVGWDPKFKIAGEHTDFAIRAKEAGLKCHILDVGGIIHRPEKNPRYKRFRKRSHASLLLAKYGCTELVQSNGKTLGIKENTKY